MATVSSTTPQAVGSFTIPWASIRELLPDSRWALWASGWGLCAGSYTMALAYQKDDSSMVTIGSQTFPAAGGYVKRQIGPYAARGTLAPTVPLEAIPSYVLLASVADGASPVTLLNWTCWLRMTPRNT